MATVLLCIDMLLCCPSHQIMLTLERKEKDMCLTDELLWMIVTCHDPMLHANINMLLLFYRPLSVAEIVPLPRHQSPSKIAAT